jgi:hypothetical protein
MIDADAPENLSEEDALALLEKYKVTMLKQYDINGALAPGAVDTEEGLSMLAGPKTELGLRRILKEIKDSENDD